MLEIVFNGEAEFFLNKNVLLYKNTEANEMTINFQRRKSENGFKFKNCDAKKINCGN